MDPDPKDGVVCGYGGGREVGVECDAPVGRPRVQVDDQPERVDDRDVEVDTGEVEVGAVGRGIEGRKWDVEWGEGSVETVVVDSGTLRSSRREVPWTQGSGSRPVSSIRPLPSGLSWGVGVG